MNILLNLGIGLSSILSLVCDFSEKIGTIMGLGFMLIAVIFLLLKIEKAIKIRFGNE